MRARSLSVEPLGDALLHEDARAGAADLPLVEPDRVDHALDDAVEVGVVEDDEGRLAAELQRQLLAAPGGGRADDAADLGGAGEGDLVDVRVLDDRSPVRPSPVTMLTTPAAGRSRGRARRRAAR
jgi:hypothetical protein